jgi:ribosomal RNA-processing protein 1
MQGPAGPLSRGIGEEAKVPDGLRYHVLDIWVEELAPVLKDDEADEVGKVLMDPIRALQREGRGKPLRKRAKEAVEEWEKLKDDNRIVNAKSDGNEQEPAQIQPSVPSDDEWEGFGD